MFRRVINPPPAHGGVPGLLGLFLMLTLLLVAAGCSERPDEPGSTAHEKSWSDPGSENFHGEFVTRQGTGSCKRCHEPHNDIPKCAQCHTGEGGHPAGWADPDMHGTEVLDDGAKQCKSCHGGNYRGGWSDVSCYACHDGPTGGDGGGDGGGGGGGSVHPAGWSDPVLHGAEVVASSASSCTSCHGSNYTGGSSGVSCYTCHDGPGGHATGWSQPSAHGANVAANGSESCSVCHGNDYRGGWAEVSCYTCHDGPSGGGGGSVHPAGWSDPVLHGAEVVAGSASSCTSCHGSNYTGGSSGVSCYTCHDGPGGHVDNYRSSSRHGADARGDSTPCRSCHGNDYRGGWAGVSCYQCHNGPNG